MIDSIEGATSFTITPEIPFSGGSIEEALAQSLVLPDFDYTVADAREDEPPVARADEVAIVDAPQRGAV